MARGIYDEQTQATLVDRTVTKVGEPHLSSSSTASTIPVSKLTQSQIAKAMSLQPPTVIVTPPPPERSSPNLESHVMEESERLHQAGSAMTAECRAREGDYATPAGLLDLALMQEGLEQRSLDGRAHWEENREKNTSDTRELFEEEALKMDTVKRPSESESDFEAELQQCERQSRESMSKRVSTDRRLKELTEFVEGQLKWLSDSERLSLSSSLQRDEDSGLATESKSARKEGSSPQSFRMIREADGGMAAPKSREDDGWVKVKTPPKASPTKEDWELIDADGSDEEWTLVLK